MEERPAFGGTIDTKLLPLIAFPLGFKRAGQSAVCATLRSMLHYPRVGCRRTICASALLSTGLVPSSLGGCGGSSDSAPAVKPPLVAIEQPVVINLYPNQSAANVARLVVMATSVGSVPVSMPLFFDTGSAGVTLYAPSIFPPSMVTAAGFVFPSGQTSISYNGITVTPQQGTRTYGSTDLRTQNGNIGYAPLTFGDSQGQLMTAVMPIFLYYSITDVETGQPRTRCARVSFSRFRAHRMAMLDRRA
jgi:hypothetical protein